MTELISSPLRLDRLSPDQKLLVRKRDGMLLSRKRVLHDLETSTNPAYRKTLEAGLKYLEQQIAELETSIRALGEQAPDLTPPSRRPRRARRH